MVTPILNRFKYRGSSNFVMIPNKNGSILFCTNELGLIYRK